MPAPKKAVPADDFAFKSFVFQDETYRVKNRFKVARFLKTLESSPVDAIELVLLPEDFERFLDLEITMDELKDFLEGLSNAMSGSSLKN